MAGVIFGSILIVGGLIVGGVVLFAAGMDPAGRGIGQTIGYGPLIGSGLIVLVGLLLVLA